MNDFDEISPHYREMLDQRVKLSGEDSHYFAAYKAKWIARVLGRDFQGKILDYGSGIGLVAQYLRREYPSEGVSLTAYDTSKESLKIGKKAVQGVEFTDQRSALSQGGYDVVCLLNVLHHIPKNERANFIGQIGSFLKIRGTLIVIEHNPLNPLARWVVHSCAFDKGVSLLMPGEVRRLCSLQGLAPEKPRYIVFFPKLFALLRGLEIFLAWLPLGAQYAIAALRKK